MNKCPRRKDSSGNQQRNTLLIKDGKQEVNQAATLENNVTDAEN